MYSIRPGLNGQNPRKMKVSNVFKLTLGYVFDPCEFKNEKSVNVRKSVFEKIDSLDQNLGENRGKKVRQAENDSLKQ